MNSSNNKQTVLIKGVSSGIEPLEVAVVISKTIMEYKPKVQYMVGPGARKMKMVSCFPAKMRDNMLYNIIHR